MLRFLVLFFFAASPIYAVTLLRVCANGALLKLALPTRSTIESRLASIRIYTHPDFADENAMQSKLKEAFAIMDFFLKEEDLNNRARGLSPYNMPTPQNEQNAILFEAMHFLRYKAQKDYREWNAAHPSSTFIPPSILRTLIKSDSIANVIRTSNYKIIRRIARLFPSAHHEDNVQEGVFPLSAAVEGFNYTYGTQFSTYAGRAIYQWLRRKTDARISIDSGETTGQNDEGTSFVESLAGADSTFKLDSERKEWAEIFQRAFPRLTENQKRAVCLIYGLEGEEPHTQDDAAVKMKVSRTRVQQHLARAMETFREMITKDPYAPD